MSADKGRLQVRILGCGSSGGVPRIGNDWGACDPSEPRNRRTRCSALIRHWAPGASEPTQVLIDTSPDMREQLLAAHVTRLDAVDVLTGIAPTLSGLGAGPYAQFWPHRHGTDAMFLALLRKG